jgi:hypothetical protein
LNIRAKIAFAPAVGRYTVTSAKQSKPLRNSKNVQMYIAEN